MMSNSYSQASVGGSHMNPRLQQWALISKAKALEYQRMKQMQKIEQYNKKMKFKHDLDAQIFQKGNTHLAESQRDREYFNHIIKKGAEQREKEERQKNERLARRRQMQEQNKMIIEDTFKNSRSRSQQNQYNLKIGVNSQIQQKLRQEQGKRDMLATLQQQLKSKKEESERKKIQQLYQDIRHNRAQAQIFQHPVRNKQYHQDQRVYQHYQRLLDDKKRQEEQMEKKLIDEAAERKARQQEVRKNFQKKRKEDLTANMKETLDQQVRIHNYKKHSQRQVNPEDVSFQFISDLYRDHPPSYNKYQYQQELRRQAEEQRNRKKNLNYMSDEEYKLNSNQLNKIMTGNYTYDQYVDRSLGAIGERKVDHRKLLDREDENTDFVRQRLQGLKNRRGGGIYSRLENSSLI